MPESKHTPGPWVPVQTNDLPDHGYGTDGWCILSAGCIAVVRGSGPSADEANAALIAAAPEMYEALRIVTQVLGQPEKNRADDWDTYLLDVVLTVRGKAEGR